MPAVSEPKPFTMPRVCAGTLVNYYPIHQGPSAPPQPAVVFESGQEAITVMILANRHLKDSVRHKSDPFLEDNVEWRKNGAWDFSEEYKHVELQKKLQHDKLDSIQKTLGDVVGALAHLTKRVDDLEKRRQGK